MRQFFRRRHQALITLGILMLLPALAYAVIPALRATGVQISSQTTCPVRSGYSGIWNQSGSPMWRSSSGTDTAMTGGGGGGASSFSALYSTSTPSNNAITESSGGGALVCSYPAIGTAQTVGRSLQNNTAAANNAQQYSPMEELVGQGWGTTASASQTVKWGIQARPVQGATANADLVFFQSINGGPFVEIAALETPASGLPRLTSPSASGLLLTADNGNSGLWVNYGNGVDINPGTGYQYRFGVSALFPLSDGVYGSGSPTLGRWLVTGSYWYDAKIGSQLTAAATITPASGIHHVTGATSITTIATTNVPASGNVALTLIADGGTITYGTGGNIAASGTIAQNTSRRFVYDSAASTWYPGT